MPLQLFLTRVSASISSDLSHTDQRALSTVLNSLGSDRADIVPGTTISLTDWISVVEAVESVRISNPSNSVKVNSGWIFGGGSAKGKDESEMNSLLKCVALRDQLNNEKESPLKTQLDLALSSVLVLLSTYSKLASSSGTHSPSILSPLIRMDNTLSNASPATEFTFLTQLGFHVRVLKAVLMADLYTDEFNIKDASVCLHEARTLLNDWIEALNDFQKDMVVPLTVIRPLPVIERRNEDVASHAERGISTNGLLGGLFNSLTPQKESQQQPSHPHFHVTSWIHDFIESVSEKYGIVFQSILWKSFGSTTSLKEWTASRLLKPENAPYEVLLRDLSTNTQGFMAACLVYQVSDVVPFHLAGFQCFGSAKDKPTGIASFPPVFVFPEEGGVSEHWPNVVSLIFGSRMMWGTERATSIGNEGVSVAQVLRREQKRPVTGAVLDAVTESPVAASQEELVDVSPSGNGSVTGNRGELEVPNVGVFGSMIKSLRLSTGYVKPGGGDGRKLSVRDGLNQTTSLYSDDTGSSSLESISGMVTAVAVPVGRNSVSVKEHTIIFYDKKVGFTYVITRVTDVFWITLMFRGAQRSQDVVDESVDPEWESKVISCLEAFVRRFLHLNVTELIV